MKKVNMKNRIVARTRRAIFNLGDRVPFLGKPLIALWRILCMIKFVIWKKVSTIKMRLKHRGYQMNLNPNKVYSVNPKTIQYCFKGIKGKRWHKHRGILEGNLQADKKFEELDIYQAIWQRFVDGREWQDTTLYHRVLKQISLGIKKWGCANEQEWQIRLKGIDALYQEIKTNGFKSKQELYSPENWIDRLEKPFTLEDNIALVVGEDGKFLVVNGRHRLAIAKALNLKKVPVNIIARHKKWLDFKKELMFFSSQYEAGIYQPCTHPDLQDIVFQRGELRFDMIKNNLTVKKGTVLDIGANVGYFCHRLEDLGFDCYAIDRNRKRAYFLKKLRDAENKKFKISTESIFDYRKGEELKFDVVLALSIFHHFIYRKEDYLDLIKLLNRMQIKEMYFEPYIPGTEKKRYIDFSPKEFVNFILEHSRLNKAELIGYAKNGRPLYKLTTVWNQ